MKIISHRGYWKAETEKNTRAAFERSFSLGFGTETDVRDYCGELVISHGIADSSCITLDDFLKVYAKYNSPKKPLLLALNIKADGLQEKLKQLLKKHNVSEYFLFDMSVPEAVQYARQGFLFFSRQSEFEGEPSLYGESAGVWMDCFQKDWINENAVSQHLNKKKKACLVSPELHKRDHSAFWGRIRGWKIRGSKELILCTDLPEDAKRFFDDQD